MQRLVCGMLVLALGVPGAAWSQQKVNVRRAAAPDISVRIAGTYATLRIVGTTVDSLVLTGTLPRNARFEAFDGGKGVEPLRGAKVFIEVPEDNAAASGELELRVPARARVWAKAGVATIEATGITGGLDLNIVGGAITVTSSPRELNIESMDGTVTIDGSPSWVRAKTAAGDIVMQGSSEDAAFTSVSGTTRVTGGRFDRGRFESVTGAIAFTGVVGRGGALTFDTHSGAIDIRLDTQSNASLEATSVAGTIENLLTRQRPATGRDGRGQELSTDIGSGGTPVTVRTFKGPIRLGRR